ncbi:MAG TPA: glycosyltransferase family 4 protein [Pyrinomonadaceae bacterium]|nr:glycosyltransferase family 4 protein [Pyrinomonadaceae bacterium]
MRARKVILLGPLPPPYGGVSVFMDALVEHLRGTGVRVWALYGDPDRAGAETRFVRHRRLGTLAALAREGRGSRVVDATHFHLEYPNAVLLPPWLALKRVLGFEWVKYVLDATLPERHARFGPARRLLFSSALKGVDEFVVVSEELRRWLQDELRVSQPVSVIPCLLPIPPRDLEAEPPADLLAALSPYLAGPRRVCSIGVFIPSYGFREAAEAVERLRAETGEDVRLALVDGTFARDEVYRAEVLRGRDWITVVENLPNRAVYQVMRRSDAYVRAVWRESYGISRVEATWCGLPVVATACGETRGMLLFEAGDVARLAAQLRRALYDPPAADVARWAETFRSEAGGNLRAFRAAMGLG